MGIFTIPFRIFLLTVAIALTGIVMVYSASGNYAAQQDRRAIARSQGVEALAENHKYHDGRYALKQSIWFVLGLLGMGLAYKVDYRRLKDMGPWLLLGSLVLLLMVFMPVVGKTINGHHRWIGLGPFTLQPSELAKLAMIIYMARMLTDHYDKIRTSFVHGVAPALIIMTVFVLAIIAEPDLGAAAMLSAITFLMWFIGGMRIRHLTALMATSIPAFIYVICMFPSRVARIVAFINPTQENMMGKGYQLLQSLIAVGAGGVTGSGLGNSMQKYFLTEQFSDFIFAIICEELGFIGASALILAFVLLIWEGWRIVLKAPDYYALVLASGITLMLGLSVALNLMVVLGLAPTKGLAMPLLSYGGSSLLVTMTAMGILMNVGKYIEYADTVSAAPRKNRARSAGTAGRRKNRKAKTLYEGRAAG